MSASPLRPVPVHLDLPALERDVLRRWREARTFERSLAATASGPRWTVLEGPPTANGDPGVHHVEARAWKDLFARWRTMQGFHVPRRAAWDCHGLPVELAVEKELGFTSRRDLEAFGVEAFNARCRASVERHVRAFEAMTERMGYWLDLERPLRTMDPEYVDAVWGSLARLFDAGLLVRDHRVAPCCPRCETTLSDHELKQGLAEEVDASAYVRLPLLSGPLAGAASLVVWTTTPWTLPGNAAVAAHPDLRYVVVERVEAGRLVVAEALAASALGAGLEVTGSFTGAELEGWRYAPPFDWVGRGEPSAPDVSVAGAMASARLGADRRDGAVFALGRRGLPLGEPAGHAVALADFVTDREGTGLVHLVPAHGEDDLRLGRALGLPTVDLLEPDGRFPATTPLVGGLTFEEANEPLLVDLERRGLLVRRADLAHVVARCWRCHARLVHRARPSWYVRTTAVQAALLRENERTTWQPPGVKDGRMGEWLRGNVDWAVSRDRAWGTPLPLWVCGREHVTCVASRAELGRLADRDLSDQDPHRPFVDAVTFPCPRAGCGATAARVPEVLDAWYDSGALPLVALEPGARADLVCEGVDQTRGWFYTLLALGVLLHDRSPYAAVACLGHVLAPDGRKMSKHLGNVLDPMAAMEAHGADALRWFMLGSGSPWAARRVGEADLRQAGRGALRTFWSVAAFLSMHGRAAGWGPSRDDPPVERRPLLDRWALDATRRAARDVTAALEALDAARACRTLDALLLDLSGWYVRRSRRRAARGDAAALATLHACLEVVTRLLAPFAPFVAERVWQDLVAPASPGAPDSVHLAAWPAEAEPVDERLAGRVALTRRLVELGRAARARAGVETRQPLARALVAAPGLDDLPDELREHLADELNVLAVEPAKLSSRSACRGSRLGGSLRARERAAAETHQRPSFAQLAPVDGEPLERVELDLVVGPALRRAGVARHVVRRLQEARRALGLELGQRVEVRWRADGDEAGALAADALREHGERVAQDVRAARLEPGPPLDGAREVRAPGLTLWLRASP